MSRQIGIVGQYRWAAVYLPTQIMSKYTEDKERVDEIAERIANREPIKEWSAIYWLAVAVGHILEWIERRPK